MPTQDEDSEQSVAENLRDVRYCEIIPVTRSGALEEDFDLVTTGLAYVINDNLYNSYQRRT